MHSWHWMKVSGQLHVRATLSLEEIAPSTHWACLCVHKICIKMSLTLNLPSGMQCTKGVDVLCSD
jgi:hypothetical protein